MAKKTSTRKPTIKQIPQPPPAKNRFASLKALLQTANKSYLSRRPHRSFRVTRRRDYVRSLKIPGYWAFTVYVWRTIRSNLKLFMSVAILYAVLNGVFVGLSSQEAYDQLSSLLSDTGGKLFSGSWGQIGQASLLLVSGIGGSFAPQLSDVQQVYALLFLLLIWLTTIWLLRALLSGNKPKLRDAVYNAGAPIVPTGLVGLAFIIQMVPLALAVIVVNVATATGFASAGLLSMVLWLMVGLLTILSLYWATSTIIALVVVTLPGMYPWHAIKTAGDLVIGRRVRVLLRLLWLFFISLAAWVVIVLPFILIDRLLKSAIPAIEWVPLVPIIITIVSSALTVWNAAYVYLLYRKVVEDDADPA